MPEPDYYPAWLSRSLLETTLPWQAAQTASMPEFLKKYSLHDSPWIGFWFGALETVAAIRWDTIWNQDVIPFPGSQVAEWPILLIRFERVYQYLVAGNWSENEFLVGEGIAAAESTLLDAQQREAMLNLSLQMKGFSDDARLQYLDESLHHTVFTGTYYRHVHLFHGGETRFLCLTPAGEVIPIPLDFKS
jgi:hypothetical protein